MMECHRQQDENGQSLIDLYCQRLHLSPSECATPSYETLCLVTERHLAHIPFSNLRIHTTSCSNDDKIILSDTDKLIEKILIQGLGGCCLELNGLFAILLKELRFTAVHLVPCWVYAGRERGHGGKKKKFRTQQSHFVLIVSHNNEEYFLVDVGLGEPPLHPLRYGPTWLDQVQVTPEGMSSRIRVDPQGPWRDGMGRSRVCWTLEWFVYGSTEKEAYWEPRLQWDISDVPIASNATCSEATITLSSFESMIPLLLHPQSSLSRKLIVCRLTQQEKVSLVGRVYKRTTCRHGHSRVVERTELSTIDHVRAVLQREFAIVLLSEQQLDLTQTDAFANTQLWEHL